MIKITNNSLKNINSSIAELNSLKSSLIKPTNNSGKEIYIKLLEDIDIVEEKLNNLLQLNQFYRMNPKNINEDDLIKTYNTLTSDIEDIKKEYSKLIISSDSNKFKIVYDLTQEVKNAINNDDKELALELISQIQEEINDYH